MEEVAIGQLGQRIVGRLVTHFARQPTNLADVMKHDHGARERPAEPVRE